ncbi:MAG TPA: hypothetical protein VFW61_03610, partial [Acinetobacter sp.]|nr:hypothetical protein [Acinetobacter sp.]
METKKRMCAIVVSFLGFTSTAFAESPMSDDIQEVLFQNVQIFDGKSQKVTSPMNVLIRGNKIQQISKSNIPSNAHTQIING